MLMNRDRLASGLLSRQLSRQRRAARPRRNKEIRNALSATSRNDDGRPKSIEMRGGKTVHET